MSQWPNSPRNEKTGPGSRGGQWHQSHRRAEYCRWWRASHPEYRQRESERSARRKARLREGKADVTFSEACRSLVRADALVYGYRTIGDGLMVAHTTVMRWLKGSLASEDLIDAVVAFYGLDRIRAERARLRREH